MSALPTRTIFIFTESLFEIRPAQQISKQFAVGWARGFVPTR